VTLAVTFKPCPHGAGILKASRFVRQNPEIQVFQRRDHFLCIIIGKNRIRMNLKKIEIIQNWQTPFYLINVQAFIKFSNFYRCFIRDFSNIIALMVALTRMEIRFH
jgi:hypothetical protein